MPTVPAHPARPARPGRARSDAQLELPLFDGAVASPAPPVSPAAPKRDGVPGAHVRSLALAGHTLPYHFKRSSRRTIGFVIDDAGLTVTAPRWVSMAEVESAIAEKQRWIFAKLAEWRERATRRAVPRVQWVDGTTVPYLGRPLTLRLGSRPHAKLPAHDAAHGTLWLDLPPQADTQQMRDRVQGWLQQEARRIFRDRLDIYADRLGIAYASLALSSAATRWGSCNADGRIRLNWRLIHFPVSIIDYVAAHELAHLKEMNHSPRFWQAVASIFPEFETARATLKEHAPEWVPEF